MSTRLSAIVLALLLSSCQKFAKDDSLKQLFYSNEANFEVMIATFRELKIGVFERDSHLETGSNPREKKLSEELKQIGARQIRQYPDEIRIVMQGEGSVLSSSEKGYCYRVAPPSPSDIVKSIDALPRPYKGFGSYYVPLKGNWYLFLFNDA